MNDVHITQIEFFMENAFTQLLIEGQFRLEKFPGKGGWTFVAFPEIPKDKYNCFGMLKVSGRIDEYEFEDVNMMSQSQGPYFLPVKSDIRKMIRKEEGDYVYVVLFTHQLPAVQLEDFYFCLKEDSSAFCHFEKMTKQEQKQLISWIFTVRNDALRVERIAQVLNRLNSML